MPSMDFGLLQAVEHFGLTGTIMTFNFLNFSVQEYLAANYIINLPANEVLKVIKENFGVIFILIYFLYM